MKKATSYLAAAAVVIASPAFAGEITGGPDPKITPIESGGVASSACAYSGLNDDGLGPSSTVQAYGMFVRAFGGALAVGPGDTCRGNL